MKLIVAAVLLLVASPAFAGLEMEIEVESAEVAFEAPVTYVVRFVNRGTEGVRYFEPHFAGMNTFPDVRLVRIGDGRELKPYDSPFQSMASRGLEGTIVTLGPGETKEYRYERARFMVVDRRTQKADWYEPRALPDGEYELRASYEQGSDLLPFNTGGFDVEPRSVPGIFTGKVRAAPVKFVVRPPVHPHVRISMPDRSSTEVRITFANPSAAEHVFRGRARFEIGSKMYGGAVAVLGEEEMSVAVPAKGSVERRVDLRALSWRRRTRAEGETPEGLGAIVPQGVCRLHFVIEAEGTAIGDGIWGMIPKVENRGLEQVEVSVTLAPRDRIAAGRPVTLSVNVENLGTEDVGFVHRLRFPRELVIRIEDADGRRPSGVSTAQTASAGLDALRPRGEDVCKLADGLSWDGDRFEPAPGLTRKDFIWIEPRAGILREIELSSLLATGLTPGRYHISAGYRNTETGIRLGFAEGHRPATGIVWSKPVVLVVE